MPGPKPPPPQKRKRRRKKRRRKMTPEQQAAQAAKGMFDVHFRIGWEDHMVRLAPPDYQKLVRYWMVAAEDVVIRVPHKTLEQTFILRGHSGGMVKVRPADPEKRVQRAGVAVMSQLGEDILKQEGL